MLTIDYETFSEAKLGKGGVTAPAYAEHMSTEVLMMSWCLSNGEIQLWIPGMPWPEEINRHILSGGDIEAWNAAFEQVITKDVLPRLVPGIAHPKLKQWHDPMAVAAYLSLPLSLEDFGVVTGAGELKDVVGSRSMKKITRPRKPTKKDTSTRWTHANAWDDYARTYTYCKQDTRAEVYNSSWMGQLPPREREIWLMDQRINQRGIYVDLQAATNAWDAVIKLEDVMTRELRQITNGKIITAGQTAKIAEFCDIPGCDKDTVDLYLAANSGISDTHRRVLEIRRALSKASTKKLLRMLDCRQDDGRVRGLYQYHAAHTGRWAGRAVQAQNLPRPALEDMGPIVADLFYDNDIDGLNLIYGDITLAAADAMRSMFTAAPGYEFYAGDFSSIEAVALAVLAGEEWKIEAFRNKEPIYEKTAEAIFGYPVNKKDNLMERGVGKICELACGYEGRVGAWRGFDKTDKFTDDEVKKFVDAWRERHPMTTRHWREMKDAAIACVLDDRDTQCRDTGFAMRRFGDREFLTMILPNGKECFYYKPSLTLEETPWGTEQIQLHYEGYRNLKGTARVWDTVDTYGGKLTENEVQSVAREIQADKMLDTEALGGMPIVMHTHDEIVSEVKIGENRYQEFLDNMGTMRDWAKKYPIGVEGWADGPSHRYKK